MSTPKRLSLPRRDPGVYVQRGQCSHKLLHAFTGFGYAPALSIHLTVRSMFSRNSLALNDITGIYNYVAQAHCTERYLSITLRPLSQHGPRPRPRPRFDMAHPNVQHYETQPQAVRIQYRMDTLQVGIFPPAFASSQPSPSQSNTDTPRRCGTANR